MSKLPVREVSKPPLSPTTQAVLALIQGLLPLMTGIIGGLWVAFTYLENQRVLAVQQQQAATRQEGEIKRQQAIRQFEARRPFLEKQLDMYSQTASVVGKLITAGQTEPNFLELERRFSQLYWIELSMVEDEGVKHAMQAFSGKFQVWKEGENKVDVFTPYLKRDLNDAAYALSQAIRASIEASWRIQF